MSWKATAFSLSEGRALAASTASCRVSMASLMASASADRRPRVLVSLRTLMLSLTASLEAAVLATSLM